jgi:hypothetical protein
MFLSSGEPEMGTYPTIISVFMLTIQLGQNRFYQRGEAASTAG